MYNAAYIEQLVLGDYHIKEVQSHHKYLSIPKTKRTEAIVEVRKKAKKFSGN